MTKKNKTEFFREQPLQRGLVYFWKIRTLIETLKDVPHMSKQVRCPFRIGANDVFVYTHRLHLFQRNLGRSIQENQCVAEKEGCNSLKRIIAELRALLNNVKLAMC